MSAHRILELGAGSKGWAVRPLKRYASWVQKRRETVRSLSGAGAGDLRGAVLSTRGTGMGPSAGGPVVMPMARLGSQDGEDKR